MTVVANARGVLLSYSAASVHHISATGAGPLLEGTASHDSFWGDSGVTVTLAGGAGDDVYHIYSANNAVQEAADEGIDTIETWMSTRLPGHIENLTVTGAGRHAFGNGLDNIVTGGDGRQTLDGGAGDDVLIGGAGSDVFSVTAGNGSDLILDFSGDDILRLSGAGFSSFGEIAARLTQQGADAVLDLGDGEILVFADTAVGDLAADQFALQIDLAGLTPTFRDDFDVLSLWDGEGGTWDSNFWWAGENGSTLEGLSNWFVDTDYGPTQSLDPFRVEDGVLTITAAAAPETLQPETGGYAYTSGLLTSFNSFAQTYGYFEIRADMPEGQGLWPAFWLLPADGSWPPELDVVELIGQDPERLIMTTHSTAGGGHAIERHYADVADSDGFHSYGVLWGPEQITWYYDGLQVAETATPDDLHDPMYLLVDLAVGGIAGAPDGDLPAEMRIDTIRAYSLDDVLGVGDETLIGGSAADRLNGGLGHDDLQGLAGADLLIGGEGNDSLRGGRGNDTLDGGAGEDTVILSASRGDLLVDLQAGLMEAAGSRDLLVSVENVLGGQGADTLRGSDGANDLRGGAGDDNLNGRRGDDLLDGGGGANYHFFRGFDSAGGDGNDTIVGFDAARDRLAFKDVIDSDADGDRDIGDLLAAVSEVTDAGPGGDVVVAFDNGASITFAGAGNGTVDRLTDLVNDVASQIQVY